MKKKESMRSSPSRSPGLRARKGLSQKRLARLLHTSQQMVSRLEDPKNTSYSLRTLIKLAHALDKELKVEFV